MSNYLLTYHILPVSTRKKSENIGRYIQGLKPNKLFLFTRVKTAVANQICTHQIIIHDIAEKLKARKWK
jgi:hypothetical protein